MDAAESTPSMRLRLTQSFRFPNCWTLRSMEDDDKVVQIFIDKLDPIGSFAEHNAREWAAKQGHVIADEYRQPTVVLR